jgi:rhamnulokinase
MSARRYLAFDVGASSGRAVLGAFDGERLAVEEIDRFDSTPVRTPTGLYVDVLGIHRSVLAGLGRAAALGAAPASVGIDTWGVSFALLDSLGQVCGLPLHYRDPRIPGWSARAYKRVSRAELYAATGVQELPFNSSFVLLALQQEPLFAAADRMLMLPDLFASWLCGVEAIERTNASTTQLYDSEAGDWAWAAIDRLGLPGSLFGVPFANPGDRLGTLLPEVAAESRLGAVTPVVAVGSHDTASAVAATPGQGDDWAYLSAGTWSLIGVERAGSVRTRAAMAANVTNELGVGGRTRLLRNVMGLWLLQESRRAWAREGAAYSFEDLIAAAETAPAFGPTVDPDHPSLLAPGDVPERLRALCAATGQAIPKSVGAVVRCALESLALKYRWTVAQLEEITGQPIRVLHVVGGGARDRLLCRLTADACGIPVVAGPVEATAMGNVLVQAMADGRIATLDEGREVVRRSVAPERYEPDPDRQRWHEAAAAFEARLPSVVE